MAHLIDAPGPGNLPTPKTSTSASVSNNDFIDDAMDVDTHIVDDPYAEIASVAALISPNEKQFELFVKKVRKLFELLFEFCSNFRPSSSQPLCYYAFFFMNNT